MQTAKAVGIGALAGRRLFCSVLRKSLSVGFVLVCRSFCIDIKAAKPFGLQTATHKTSSAKNQATNQTKSSDHWHFQRNPYARKVPSCISRWRNRFSYTTKQVRSWATNFSGTTKSSRLESTKKKHVKAERTRNKDFRSALVRHTLKVRGKTQFPTLSSFRWGPDPVFKSRRIINFDL